MIPNNDSESDAYTKQSDENHIALLNTEIPKARRISKEILDGMKLSNNGAKPPIIPKKSEGMKFDTGKLLYSLIPVESTEALAEVLTFGAKKYAPNNWQLVDNGEVRYLDALYRHLAAHRKGEKLDPESGLSHLSHALTNVAFLHYLETNKGK